MQSSPPAQARYEGVTEQGGGLWRSPERCSTGEGGGGSFGASVFGDGHDSGRHRRRQRSPVVWCEGERDEVHVELEIKKKRTCRGSHHREQGKRRHFT
jgi:hypothetical protein